VPGGVTAGGPQSRLSLRERTGLAPGGKPPRGPTAELFANSRRSARTRSRAMPVSGP
jgi:hypothetical protein